MSSTMKLEEIDVDGAIRETAHEAGEALESEGDTRLEFLKKAGLAGGAVVGGGAMLGTLGAGTAAAAKGNKLDRPPKSFGKGDTGILNYALTLEYLEAEFYKEANRNNKGVPFITGPNVQDFLDVVVRDEKAHVKALKDVLGRKAVKKPKFDFGTTTSNQDEFIATSFALENTGVGAYSGQAFNIKKGKVLAAALSIVTIEARHAGLIGQILDGSDGVAPDGPFDKAVGAKKTLKAVEKTGFITG
jgi:rubrerythrin